MQEKYDIHRKTKDSQPCSWRATILWSLAQPQSNTPEEANQGIQEHWKSGGRCLSRSRVEELDTVWWNERKWKGF